MTPFATFMERLVNRADEHNDYLLSNHRVITNRDRPYGILIASRSSSSRPPLFRPPHTSLRHRPRRSSSIPFLPARLWPRTCAIKRPASDRWAATPRGYIRGDARYLGIGCRRNESSNAADRKSRGRGFSIKAFQENFVRCRERKGLRCALCIARKV